MLIDEVKKAIRERSVVDLDSSGDEHILLARLRKAVGHSDNRLIKIMATLEFEPIFIGHKLIAWRVKPETFLIKMGDQSPLAAFSPHLAGAKVEATNMLRYGCGDVVILDARGEYVCHRQYRPDTGGRAEFGYSGFGWTAWQTEVLSK